MQYVKYSQFLLLIFYFGSTYAFLCKISDIYVEFPAAFFDMYIGDVPVSEQAKEEIGRNVANIIRRC